VDENALHAQGTGLLEDFAQRPVGQAAAARGRAYAVADVADVVVEFVPQGDSSEYLAVVDDPAG
jgi:hypothetical protein